MDSRTLMARLGPRSISWGIVAQVRPEFSPQDIAAALGMIKDKFARELFCYLYWPDQSDSSFKDIEQRVLHRLMEECKARTMNAIGARFAYTMAEVELVTARANSRAVTLALAQYRAAMELANERKWPSPRATYRNLVHSVLREITAPAICAHCHGSGQHTNHRIHVTCPVCHGDGVVPLSDLARARSLGVTWHAYRKAWKAPYEWADTTCKEALGGAERALIRHLGYTRNDNN
ncbi:hypothetical protein ABIC75_004514 [Dyella japonica]|uniref:Uncharacterized protein n=1 Tax=Dyella japonica TaxID=231455 RepID=A0ABV2K108_9GAMM